MELLRHFHIVTIDGDYRACIKNKSQSGMRPYLSKKKNTELLFFSIMFVT
jgi:hypothetical protein